MHDQLGGLLRTVEPDLLFTVRPDGSVVYPPEFDGTFLAGLFSNAIEALPLLVTVTEKLEFQSGQQLWDWLTNSNPIVGTVLADLSAPLRPIDTTAVPARAADQLRIVMRSAPLTRS